MSPDRTGLKFIVAGKSIKGASHIKSGLPNQDAIAWKQVQPTGLPLILAVSDGHGSSKCFRSDIGSSFAVRAAVEAFDTLLKNQKEGTGIPALKHMAEENLPREMWTRWRNAVADHVRSTPFTDAELSKLQAKDGESAARQALLDPASVYGATLMAVLMADNYVVFMQIGDGDILVYLNDGQVFRPIEKNPELMANETTSLCMTNPRKYFNIVFKPITDQVPAMIMVSTDGYFNSYKDDASFNKVGRDIIDLLKNEGIEYVELNMDGWLENTTKGGSGDDITLGIICSSNILKKPDLQAKAEIEKVIEEKNGDITMSIRMPVARLKDFMESITQKKDDTILGGELTTNGKRTS